MSTSVDYSWTESWGIFPAQPRVFRRARQPASGHSSGGGGGFGSSRRPACRAFSLAGSSTTATDPAAAAPGRRDGARYGTAGTDPADTPRRPSPVHRTARSIGGPRAPCEPADACPAPEAPSHARPSPPDPPVARSTDSETAHHPAAAASLLKATYRESRQPDGPGVEREPVGTPGATVRQRDERRRGRCSQQPTADDTRPRYGEALRPKGAGGLTAYARDHSYSRNISSILRLTISCRPSMHLA